MIDQGFKEAGQLFGKAIGGAAAWTNKPGLTMNIPANDKHTALGI